MKSSLGAGKKYQLRNPCFYRLASAAANSERLGEYTDAAELWSEAMDKAINTSNRAWSEHRHLFCLSALRNGWTGGIHFQPQE
ncbi:ANR family transcriptional regulator [Pantoea sp. ME81]|uniref:ANR family transcriptional regulator n=1 Tax=Pantoea TaxID=53335 RepID=UPI0015F3EEB3|nr:ANR family transcriptional regulator [Pantoea sp. ME81]